MLPVHAKWPAIRRDPASSKPHLLIEGVRPKFTHKMIFRTISMLSLSERSERLFAADRPGYLVAIQISVMTLIIVFFQGIHFSDSETARYLQKFISGSVLGVPRGSGQSLEGILQDLIEMAFVEIGTSPLWTSFIGWFSGLCFLAAVIFHSVTSRSTTVWTLFLVVAFSHMVDTLSHYIGKFDPFTISFLWLSASNRRPVSIVGSILAAFSHPFVALMSTAGIVCLKLHISGKLDWKLSVVVILASILDVVLFHRLFPTVQGRTAFIFIYLTLLLKDAAQYGLLTLISSIVVPIATILYFNGRSLFNRRAVSPNFWGLFLLLSWAFAVVAVACVFTLDHTRVSFLLTLAPLLLLPQIQPPRTVLENSHSVPWGAFWLIFLARLTTVQVGFPFFQWHDLRILLG